MRARSAVLPAADDTFGVLHHDAPVRAFDEDDRGDDGDHHHQQEQDAEDADRSGVHLIERLDDAAREPDNDAREDQQRHAVADAAFGDLLAEPHDEDGAGRQRQHAEQTEAPPRVVDERQAARTNLRIALEEDGDAQRLDDRQHAGQVAGVLRDLAAAQLPLTRQPLEVRPDDRQQLQDDRRADVGHDAQREDRHLRQVPAGEHVVEAEHRVLLRVGERRQRGLVHAGCRDVVPDAIHAEHRQREEHAVPQVDDLPQILERVVLHRYYPFGAA